jgi:hypothetical protein
MLILALILIGAAAQLIRGKSGGSIDRGRAIVAGRSKTA